MVDGLRVREEEQSTTTDIVTLVLVIAVLVAPLLIHTHYYIEAKSILWSIRIERGEPIRFMLTITRVFAIERYLPMYLFVLMVHRLYTGKTKVLRVLLVGLVACIYLPVYENLGGVLYLITSPWAIGNVHFEVPTFIPVIVFFFLVRLVPYSKTRIKSEEDEWLNVEE